MEETIEELKALLKQEKRKVEVLEQKLSMTETPGKVKLYYSLNRNMNDLSDMLDKIKLIDLDLEDPKNKTFERLKIIWASVSPLVETLRILGEAAGVTGEEAKDISKKIPFIDSIADKRN